MKKLDEYEIKTLFSSSPVSDVQISPDGGDVLFTYTVEDIEGNKRSSHIWKVRADGGEPKQYTFSKGTDSQPRWSPDGRRILFVSSRESEGDKEEEG